MMDEIDAIAAGLTALGMPETSSEHHARARASLIKSALDQCGFLIVRKPLTNEVLAKVFSEQ